MVNWPRCYFVRRGSRAWFWRRSDSRPIVDHIINLPWFRNQQRGFAPRLQPPLIYQETVARGEPGPMYIECNIHGEEYGYVAATEHGNIAVTDDDGFARLSDWPVGRQKLVLTQGDRERNRQVSSLVLPLAAIGDPGAAGFPAARIDATSTSRCSSGQRAVSAQLVMVKISA